MLSSAETAESSGTAVCACIERRLAEVNDSHPANRLHSWLSPKSRIRSSRSGGFGIFADGAFSHGELVCVWGGIILTDSELLDLSRLHPHLKTHAVEIYPGFFQSSTSLTSIDDAERFSHSCNPNVGLRGHLTLFARRDIDRGEELTIDYQTISIDPNDDFECRCGSDICRRRLTTEILSDQSWLQNNATWLSPLMLEKTGMLRE